MVSRDAGGRYTQLTSKTSGPFEGAGRPSDIRAERIQLFMPPMGLMPAMRSETPLKPAGRPGVFEGTLHLGMHGTWQATLTYTQGEASRRAAFNLQAQ